MTASLTLADSGKWHVETSHGTYYDINLDNRTYSRTAGVGRNQLSHGLDTGRFSRIRCTVGEPLMLDSSESWVQSTPVTVILPVSPAPTT